MKRKRPILIAALATALIAFIVARNSRQPKGFIVGPSSPPGKVAPQLATAWGLALMIAPDGTLWGWGGGQAPTSSILLKEPEAENPIRISDENNWQRVAVGPGGATALKANGSLWVWGANTVLATGRTNLATQPTRVGDDTNWVDISAGSGHTLARKQDGSLWAWGQNDHGQIGDGTKTNNPVKIRRLGSDSDWMAISAGSFNSYALKRNGTVWGWGLDPNFPKGSTDILRPKQIDPGTNWTKLAAGDYHLAALRQDGTLWVCGQNSSLVTSSAAGPIATLTQVDTDRDWSDICSGANFFLARKTDGSWWASGRNDCGQLGLGTIQSGSGTALTRLPFDFDPWAIASGAQSTILLTKDGTLWSWGRRLGSKPRSVPMKQFKEIINEISKALLKKQFFQPSEYWIDLTPHQLGTFRSE